MAGRGMLFDEGPTACPFVALETDRDRRAAEPDPRHRCYAEPTPTPRALAHQREFCLAPGFGACPIFQDWAIRAAARPVPLRPAIDRGPATDERTALEQLGAFGSRPSERPASAEPDQPLPSPGDPGEAGQERYMRPPEPAAAPPPGPAPIDRVPSMSTDAQPSDQRSGEGDEPSGEVEAPRRRRQTEDWPPAASAAAPLPPFLAGREGEAPAEPARRVDYAQRHEPAPRQHARPSQRADLVPAWERERYAAYPTIGRRFGGGDAGTLLGRLTKLFGVLAIVTLLGATLLLLPNFLGGIAGPGPASPSPTAPTATASPTVPPTPTPVPEPTTITHRIAAGETLFAISVEYGVTVEQILAANPAITNPNLIQVGQVIVIPPDDFEVPTAAPAQPSP